MENVKVDFSSFVLSLATGAVSALSEAELLKTGKATAEDGTKKDIPAEEAKQKLDATLNAARHLIDTMAMLDEKTKGNLSDGERQVLQGSLTNLRIQYVKLATPVN